MNTICRQYGRKIVRDSLSPSSSRRIVTTINRRDISYTRKLQSPLSDEPASLAQAPPKVQELFERIKTLNTVEVHLLQEVLKERLGSDQLFSGDFGAASGGGAASEEKEEEVKVEEKTAFDLKLTGFDAKSKIKVIKEIRSITALGLKEAKELVEGAPKVIKKDIKKEEAEELKAKIEAVGGTVEIE